jgi:hypothetical protein
VPYILDEFTYFFETPFDTTDPTFPELVFPPTPLGPSLTNARCTLDRPAGASPTGRMYIVNHFLDVAIGSVLIPDDPADSTTNSASGIEAQANLCNGIYGRMPNGVLVDYFNVGKYMFRSISKDVLKIKED